MMCTSVPPLLRSQVRTGQLDSKKPPRGMWRCGACTVFNKDSLHFCKLCETARS